MACMCTCVCVYLSSPQFTVYSLTGGFGNFINQGMAKVWMPYSWSTLYKVPVDLPRGGTKPMKCAKGGGALSILLSLVTICTCK